MRIIIILKKPQATLRVTILSVPFPPGEDTNKLPGGKNYTVVLRAVDENGKVLNTEDADRQKTFEFISDGIPVSKSASYAITSTGRAFVDSNNKNVLKLTLLASDPLYQIVDDKYSLFVKQIKDSNGNSVTGKILGMNADGELCWMTSENGTGAVKATDDVTLGGDGKYFLETGYSGGRYDVQKGDHSDRSSVRYL